MCTKLLCVVVLALYTYNVTVECGQMSMFDQDLITTFQGVAITTCKKECESRKRCRSVVYYRLALFCILSPQTRDILLIISKPEAIVLGSDRLSNEADTCDGSTCSDSETCSAVDEGSRICQIKECKMLPSFYENVLGNMYAVGQSLIAKGHPSDMRVTCGADGEWIPDASHDVNDCSDMFGPSGVYENSLQHDIYCDMDTAEGHWLVFQRRQDGSVDFLRNWEDYQTGFGNLSGEFWLGLDTMYEILRVGEYELRVDLEDFDGDKRYAEYDTFSISDETDNYRLTVTGYTGNAGNGLGGHSGYEFSTIDKDNDNCTCKCAVSFSGAWWYNKCHSSTLNSLYYPNGTKTTSYANHVHWNPFQGYWISLKKTEMKFRRKWN